MPQLETKQEGRLLQPIQIVIAISKDFNMNFGLEKCARIYLKKRQGPKRNMYIGSTSETYNKELDPREACKYLGIDESHEKQHKNEKGKLKKEYLMRLRLDLGTELSAKNKIQAIGSLTVPVLIVLQLLTGYKKNCKN